MINKNFKTLSLIALTVSTLLTPLKSLAKTTAITNATLFTGTEQGVLKNATLVFEDGVITQVNPSSFTADTTIDGSGKIVSPGLIGSLNRLGLVEVGAVAGSRDAYDKKSNISFNAARAFNPESTLIPYARKGGITRNVIFASGGDGVFQGQTSVVNLSGTFDSVVSAENGVFVSYGEQSKGSRAQVINTLFSEFKDQHKKLGKSKKISDDSKEPSEKERVLTALLNKELPLIVHANRSADLLQLIELKQAFNLNLVIAGAADGWRVKEQLAQAEIPVVLSAVENLPGSFDSLGARLDNAALLNDAGVKVALTVKGDSSHNVYQLRFDAGIAVANGLDPNVALKAVTSHVADIFDIKAGKLAKGFPADIVIWSGDPFEFSSHVEQMFIDGIEKGTESRHDRLRERYIKESKMPRSYSK